MHTLVIHHDDPDGRMGGYLMRTWAVSRGDTVTTVEANYNSTFDFPSLVKPEDQVVIVDYSLNHQMFAKLTEIVDKKQIIWLDHHKSNIEKYTEQADLEGLRYDGIAGCELAYIYSKGWREKSHGKLVNTTITGGELEFKAIEEVEIPRGVRMIGDFDCWRHGGEGVEYSFISGINSYWNRIPLTTDEGLQFWEQIASTNESFINDLISQGTVVERYIASENECNVKSNAFPCKLRKFEELKAIAINTDARSSRIFKSVFDEYEIGLVFNYVEKPQRLMTFSIYRLGANPDKDIDVSKIAQTFGGGGHHDASGFSTNGTLPFVR